MKISFFMSVTDFCFRKDEISTHVSTQLGNLVIIILTERQQVVDLISKFNVKIYYAHGMPDIVGSNIFVSNLWKLEKSAKNYVYFLSV